MTSERWRKVEEVYHSALDRNAEERRAFLDEICGGDQEFGARSSRCWRKTDRCWSIRLGKRSELKPGARLGFYEIVAKLGEGGMGVVYRAQDTKLNRPVAIKLFSDQLADAEARTAVSARSADGLVAEPSPHSDCL